MMEEGRTAPHPTHHPLRTWIAAVLLLPLPAQAAERVVSLNLCTDQMLVLLAPEKVAALSPLARDPALSFVAEQAAGLPTTRASAEAILRLHPDLVLAAPWGAQTTLAILAQEGIPIDRVDLPQDFPAIRAQTRTLGVRLGHPERADNLIAEMDATLAALPHPPRPETALAIEPRGYTAPPDSLMGAVLTAAGLTNVSNGRPVSLEALLRHPPGLLVVPAAPDYPSLATDMLDNPVLASLPRRAVPPALTICAGPFTAQAAALLAQ
jgi:iron complex transport system substrate-binding protein